MLYLLEDKNLDMDQIQFSKKLEQLIQESQEVLLSIDQILTVLQNQFIKLSGSPDADLDTWKKFERTKKEKMEEIDWKKIYNVMCFLDWRWMGKTPTIQEMKKFVSDLLNRASRECLEKHVTITMCCGGFEVQAIYNKETNEIDISIKFILSGTF